jgi:hypothetical protein
MWLYGSGFPKSHNIGKAIDKFGGNNLLSNEIGNQLKEARTKRGLTLKAADELFCGGTSNYNWLEGRSDGQRIPNQELFDKIVAEWPELKDIRDKVLETEREILGTEITNKTVMSKIGEENESGEYVRTKGQSDWEGWGTSLKPANEPICVARKPLSEKSVAENVLKWGTGGINIDGCRIETKDNLNGGGYGGNNVGVATYALTDGRKTLPTNKLGKEDFTQPEGRFPANVILDEIAGELLDEQSGISKGTKTIIKGKKEQEIYGNGNGFPPIISERGHNDSGGASRFFYQAKVSKSERNMGLDDFEEKNKWLKGGVGVGITDRENVVAKNIHPTVKPVRLMAYLCRLVTPPNGVVLDPFMGSGSTGIAAQLEGFNFIGMELDQEYMNIAEARINNYEDYRKFL